MQLAAYCKEAFLCQREYATDAVSIKQMIKAMKLTSILLLAATLQVSARGYSQNVTLKVRAIPLEKVMTEIQHQTGYRFIYEKEEIDKATPVTIEVNSVPLADILPAIFGGQHLNFVISGKFIVISPGGQVFKEAADEAPSLSIQGTVFDEAGKPVPGVTVTVKGTNVRSATDENGEFHIKNVGADATLVLTATNIETTEMKLAGRSTLIIQVKTRINKLDDVMVIGYGTTTQRTSTGSVSKVSSEEIERQPVTNPLQALSGRVPGLLITENSGTPGAGITVQIRAASALTAGTAPLYVIDGVPYLSEAVYTAGGNDQGYLAPAFGSNPLNAINPADIESIDVLKDADATAIYGSRGANGVILITTKKGKAGKSRFEVKVGTGEGGVADLHRVSMVTMPQYLEMRRAAYANAGATPTVAGAPDLKLWDTTKTTDFRKVLIGGTSHVTDASASFSGGNNQTTFLLSGNYHRETAIIPGNYAYGKGSVHFGVEHSSADKKFSAAISSTFVVDKNTNVAMQANASDLAHVAYSIAPNFPLYDSTGKNLYWPTSQSFFFQNPLSYTYQRYSAVNNNLIGNIVLKYNPLPGLNFKLSTGYNKLNLESKNLSYSKSINPYSGGLPYAGFQENYAQVWNLEPQANYVRSIGGGRLDLLAGATFQDNTFEQPYYLIGTNYSSDALLNNPASAGTIGTYTFSSEYKYSSVFGRLNYNWKNKYILNINYRWDASSKFGTNDRYGSFASVGGAWIFSEESFVKGRLPALSFGKLRSSYGSSGNDQIGNYQYLDTYQTTYYGYNNVSGLVPSRVANPNLKWEVNKKLEAALELGFFKDRILLTVAWFRNRTGNSLVSYPLANLAGFSSYTANLNALVQQQGWEFTLVTQNVKSKDFTWTTNFNISNPSSKLVSFPGIANSGYVATNVVGDPMSAIYGWHYTGINSSTSLPAFLDANKDGTTSVSQTSIAAYGQGDWVKIGNSMPAFFGGINNSFQYKGLQLDVFLQFSGRRMIYGIGGNRYSPYQPGYAAQNMYAGAYQLFKKTNGQIASTQLSYADGTPYASYTMYSQSDAAISNAAYLRLKNISLTYTLPGDWVKHAGMNSAMIYLRGQNLFTVTHFNGFDPESAASNIPPLRMLTAGLKLSF